MSKLDQEPAFPVPEGTQIFRFGMTLRDYFAAQAMSCLIKNDVDIGRDGHHVAHMAYQMADKMLRARK